MLVNFFYSLRESKIPVTVKEFLHLLEAMSKGLAFGSVDEFYTLSRACLVKDEKFYDRFDQAFGAYFKNIESFQGIMETLIPDDWIRSEFLKNLSEEDKQKVNSLGGLEKLIEEFKKRLEEQQERHAGGSKWVGTGGTSPFGNSGYHPNGMRVGGESKNKSAAKIWEKREFKNLDDSVELGTRNIKVALKKLREFARSGAEEELDLNDTIRSTAHNGGLLDIKLVPERHNAVKVLLFFDIGGSMDPYIQMCEELFSAAKTEFKHLEYYYFHNFIYDYVWRDNQRRQSELLSTYDLIHTYGKDYKVIFIGDASMSPYEVLSKYGCNEYMNEEPGQVWMQRILDQFDKAVWLNPVDEKYWHYTQTIELIREQFDHKMFPLTLDGIDKAINHLTR
jgi:uncharacterized protein with von Willebrand factor type A (vWA) domain